MPFLTTVKAFPCRSELQGTYWYPLPLLPTYPRSGDGWLARTPKHVRTGPIYSGHTRTCVSEHMLQEVKQQVLIYGWIQLDHWSNLKDTVVFYWQSNCTIVFYIECIWVKFQSQSHSVSEWTGFIVALTIFQSHSDWNKVYQAQWLDLWTSSCM